MRSLLCQVSKYLLHPVMKPGNFLNVLKVTGLGIRGEGIWVAGQCLVHEGFNKTTLFLFSNLDIESSEHLMGWGRHTWTKKTNQCNQFTTKGILGGGKIGQGGSSSCQIRWEASLGKGWGNSHTCLSHPCHLSASFPFLGVPVAVRSCPAWASGLQRKSWGPRWVKGRVVGFFSSPLVNRYACTGTSCTPDHTHARIQLYPNQLLWLCSNNVTLFGKKSL